MAHYCSGCNNNWARLYTYDCDQHEDAYAACPICRTDAHVTFVNNNDNLVWLPLFTSTPIPLGFASVDEYQNHLHKIFLSENNLTEEEWQVNVRNASIESQKESIKKSEERKEFYLAKEEQRYRNEDAEIERRINNL